MTAPLCIGCQKNPVKRRSGRGEYGIRGPRIEHGLRWGWFCSRSCGSAARSHSRETMQKIAAARVKHGERRVMERLIAACKERMDEHGRVDPRDFVRVMMLELRKQYQRQYQRARFQQRKAA
jgi:hypothetical protein